MRPASKSERADPNAFRITMQYHRRNGTVYELERADIKLDVHVSPEQDQAGASAPASGQWLVGAQSSREQDAVIITERAATRAEALRLVGETWTACARSRNLPLVDWTAVEKVLLAVRAL